MTPWRVVVLDTKRSNPNHYIYLAIVNALRQSDRVEYVAAADYRAALHEAQRGKCNLFIAFDGEELDRSIVERIAGLCERSVLWITEDPYERRVNQANADLFDLVFSNDTGSVAAYSEKGRSLVFAADPEFHFHPVPSSDHGHYLYDLFFAGTAWPNRAEFLASLQRQLPDIRLKLALPSNPYIPAPKLNMEQSAYDWRTPNTEFAKFANRSRAVLTLHRAFSSSGNEPVAHTPGPRFFEVALAGGFQLVDMSLPEIRVQDFYEENKEFIGFRDVGECIEKLAYYLSHPEERLEITRRAQAKTRQMHLYAHRVTRLLAEIDLLPPRSIQEVASPSAVIDQAAPRQRVLVVSHNTTGVAPYGGVEVYQESVRLALAGQFEFWFYTPDRSAKPLGKAYSLRDENLQVVETVSFTDGLNPDLLTCPQREAAFSDLLRRYGIELVHFQHLIGHPLSLPLLTRPLGIRSLLSLHDYYGICARFNLVDYRGVYCGIDKLPKETCDVCLNAADGAGAGSQARRRAFMGRVLSEIDVLHANTPGVAAMFTSLYPQLSAAGKIEVNGVPMPRADVLAAERREASVDSPLRIAVPGNFTRNKGGNELVHAFNQLRDDDVQIDILGPVAAEYEPILDVLKIPNLHVHGPYAPGSLPRLLRDHDVSIHFSIWPETYCISLSEAWAAGLVPIVADIGALGERVNDRVNGLKVPLCEAGALVHAVRTLAADRAQLLSMRSNIGHSELCQHDAHMAWLSSTYSRLMPRMRIAASPGTQRKGNTIADLGILLVDSRWLHPPVGSTVAGGGSSPLAPVAPVSLPKRAWRYLRTYGLRRTLGRVIQAIARRMEG